MASITSVAIRRPVATTMAFLILIVIGIVSLRSLPVDQDELLRAMREQVTEVELAWGDRKPIPVIAPGGKQ